MRCHALSAAIVALAARSTAQTELVTITGGADDSKQNYAWNVTNQHASPIVAIEIPHYHADTFIAPEGWTKNTPHEANLHQLGAKDTTGLCKAWVDSPAAGIAPGSSGKFGLRISKAGADRGRGDVRVRFADGKQTVVSGVQLPVAPSLFEVYAMPAGLGGLLLVFLLVQARRRRLRRQTESSEPT